MPHTNKNALQELESLIKKSAVSDIRIVPQEGWIRSMRKTLGMSLRKLGEACEMTIASIAQIESRELEGRITIETLRKVASAMNCDLAYTLVPKSNMKSYVDKAAYEKAKRILLSADLHMSLENQQVQEPQALRIEQIKKKLIAEGKVW